MIILLAIVALVVLFAIGFVTSRNAEAESSRLSVVRDEPDIRDPYREHFHEKAVREAEQAAVSESNREQEQNSVRIVDGEGFEAGGIKWHISAEIPTPHLGPERMRAYEEAVDAASHPGVWRIQLAGHTHETRVGNIVRKSIYKELVSGQPLRMVREPTNPYDFQCISLWLDPPVGPALDVGFIPRAWALTFAGLMDRRAEFEASVYEVKRSGLHGEFLCLIAEIRQTKEPELKHRPKREAVLRAYEKSKEAH